MIAGGFAALAGALYAFLKGSVFPDNISISLSIDGLVMVLLGGVGTVSGGVVGAAIYRSLSIWVISHTDYSKLVLGALIILLVVLFPKGLVGAFEAWRSARTGARLQGAEPMSILVVEEPRQDLFRLPGGAKRELCARSGRDACADRAEWRGQEHLLQYDRRPARADDRPDRNLRQEHRRHDARRHLAPRRRTDIPGRRDLRLDDGRGECADGADLASCRALADAPLGGALPRRRGGASARSRRHGRPGDNAAAASSPTATSSGSNSPSRSPTIPSCC